jgi:hypothetical protein
MRQMEIFQQNSGKLIDAFSQVAHSQHPHAQMAWDERSDWILKLVRNLRKASWRH